MTATPDFKLYRSTSGTTRCAYQGYLRTPDGKIWLIDADVSESDTGYLDVKGRPTGTKVRFFTGTVRQANGATLARSAKVSGDRSALPPDLLTVLEQLPFDDPLPPLAPEEAAATTPPRETAP